MPHLSRRGDKRVVMGHQHQQYPNYFTPAPWQHLITLQHQKSVEKCHFWEYFNMVRKIVHFSYFMHYWFFHCYDISSCYIGTPLPPSLHYRRSQNRNWGGAKTCSTPPYSLNPSSDLAKNLAGGPLGVFIWPNRRVFLISLPGPSYGG